MMMINTLKRVWTKFVGATDDDGVGTAQNGGATANVGPPPHAVGTAQNGGATANNGPPHAVGTAQNGGATTANVGPPPHAVGTVQNGGATANNGQPHAVGTAQTGGANSDFDLADAIRELTVVMNSMRQTEEPSTQRQLFSQTQQHTAVMNTLLQLNNILRNSNSNTLLQTANPNIQDFRTPPSSTLSTIPLSIQTAPHSVGLVNSNATSPASHTSSVSTTQKGSESISSFELGIRKYAIYFNHSWKSDNKDNIPEPLSPSTLIETLKTILRTQ